MNRDTAAERFLEAVILDALNGAVDGVHQTIVDEPTQGVSPEMMRVRELYHRLDGDGRATLDALIRESAVSAIFSMLVLLDQTTVDSNGTPVDFAVYLHELAMEDPTGQDDPVATIRINPRTNVFPLHDQFLQKLDRIDDTGVTDDMNSIRYFPEYGEVLPDGGLRIPTAWTAPDGEKSG